MWRGIIFYVISAPTHITTIISTLESVIQSISTQLLHALGLHKKCGKKSIEYKIKVQVLYRTLVHYKISYFHPLKALLNIGLSSEVCRIGYECLDELVERLQM